MLVKRWVVRARRRCRHPLIIGNPWCPRRPGDTKRHKPIPRRDDASAQASHHQAMFNAVPERNRTMQPWIKKPSSACSAPPFWWVGSPACSGGHHYRYGPTDAESMTEMRGKVIERVGRKLDLDDAQKQKLGVLADRVAGTKCRMVGSTADPALPCRPWWRATGLTAPGPSRC